MKYHLAAALLAAAPALADEAEDRFVEANILGIFYHELGHALIDVFEVPIFGQEEDAADVASILLIDQLFDPEVALDLAYDVASGFWAEAEAGASAGVAYWDTHGPDAQRFYNTVCLFYGGDPEARDDFAADMDLPEERAETCPEEYDLAMESWGAVFDDAGGTGKPMRFRSADAGTVTAQVIAKEVDALNADFAFPAGIEVVAEPCGEANAFYDPGARQIIMCEEFEAHLRALYAELQN